MIRLDAETVQSVLKGVKMTEKRLIDLGKYAPSIEAFFTGKLYPLIPAALSLLGHISGLEFYLNFINILLFAFGTLATASAKPFIAIFLTYTYQISLKNTPSFPVHSGYYLEGARPYLIALCFVVGVGSFVFSLFYRGVINRESLKALPMKASSISLAAAFLLGGAFSSDYTVASTLYGAAQILGFFIVFYLMYLAFRRENADGLVDHVLYVSLLVSIILIAETAHLYLTSDNLIVDGSVVKDNVLYGWGIWNNAGQKLTILIPVLFIGVIRGGKSWWVYFTAATFSFIAAVFTLSRTALIFATLAYVTSVIIAATVGKRKRLFRIITLAGVAAALLFVIVFREKLMSVLSDYLERGLDDNGRYALWKYGIDSFLDSPVFGKGFFGLHTDTFISIDFIPQMMHNTPIQLLASMGIVGTATYIWHRVQTVREFFSAPSLEKTMIGIACLTMLLGSFLENFVFYVEPMFYFSTLLALVFRMNSKEKADATPENPVSDAESAGDN